MGLVLLQIRAPRHRGLLRVAESAGLAALTVVTMLGLSYFMGTCVEVPQWQEKDYGFTLNCPAGMSAANSCRQSPATIGIPSIVHHTEFSLALQLCLLQTWLEAYAWLDAGKVNDLATAFMTFPDRTISHLFSLGSLSPQV